MYYCTALRTVFDWICAFYYYYCYCYYYFCGSSGDRAVSPLPIFKALSSSLTFIVPIDFCCSIWGLPVISYQLNSVSLDEACLPRAVTKVSWNCSCINSFKKSSLFLRALEAPWRPSHWPNNQALPELFGRKINHAGHCNLGQWQIELSSVKRYFNLTLALTATSFRSKNFFLHTHKFVIVNVCLNGPTRYVSFHRHFY